MGDRFWNWILLTLFWIVASLCDSLFSSLPAMARVHITRNFISSFRIAPELIPLWWNFRLDKNCRIPCSPLSTWWNPNCTTPRRFYRKKTAPCALVGAHNTRPDCRNATRHWDMASRRCPLSKVRRRSRVGDIRWALSAEDRPWKFTFRIAISMIKIALVWVE
jgi:hypothetical protein